MKPRAAIVSVLASVAAFTAAGLVVTNNYACGCAPPKPENQTLPTVTASTAPIPGDIVHVDPGTWVNTGNLAAYPITNYAYRWARCDANGGGCVDAAGTPHTCTEAATSPAGCDYTIADGDAGGTLRAEVTATNAGGQTTIVSLITAQIGGAPPPPPAGTASAPTNVTASPGDRRVDLNWGASTCTGCTIAGYHIIRDGTQIAAVTDPTTSYADTNVANGTTYTYIIKAYDTTNKEGDPSQAVQAVPQAAPPPPAGAQVAATPDGPPSSEGPWRVEYADAFGSPQKYFGGLDNTVWPNRYLGATGQTAAFNGNEMELHDPAQISDTANGEVHTCTRTSGLSSGKTYLCGLTTVGALTQSNGSTPPAGYTWFRYLPFHGTRIVIQGVIKWPFNTGEADPGFWAIGPPWNSGWELDYYEGWGWQKKNTGWCTDQVGWPGSLRNGSVSGEHSGLACSSTIFGEDPAPTIDSPFHTFTIDMGPTQASGYDMYYDGKHMWHGTMPALQAFYGNIIEQYDLRNGPMNGPCNWSPCNNDTNFPSGSRTSIYRSVTVYEPAADNNANTQTYTGSPPLIAPGTCIIGQTCH